VQTQQKLRSPGKVRAQNVGPALDRGRLLNKLNQIEAAIRDLDCAVSSRPASSDAHHYRSRALYKVAHSRYPDQWPELFGRAEAEGDLAFRLDSLDGDIRKHREFLAG
jgi:hypothetical protein